PRFFLGSEEALLAIDLAARGFAWRTSRPTAARHPPARARALIRVLSRSTGTVTVDRNSRRQPTPSWHPHCSKGSKGGSTMATLMRELGKGLLPAVVMVLALVVGVAVAPAQQAATPSSADRTFAHKAASGGQAEVELGKLAQERASSDAVKQFGER